MKTPIGLVFAICLSSSGAALAQTPAQAPAPAPTASDYANALMSLDCPSCEAKVETLRGFSLASPSTSHAPPAAAPRPSAASPTTATATPQHRTGAQAPTRLASATAPKVTPVVSANDLMITFERGSSALAPAGAANAKTFAEALNDPRLAGLSFLIIGHTDATGSAEHNMTLSEQRAEAVKAYLVQQGVDAARLQTKGYGSQQLAVPAAPGAAANRRVEVKRIG